MLSTLRFQPTRERTFKAPTTIGVISDTHIHLRGARRMPPEVVDLFIRFRVGLILHAGDVNTSGVLLALSEVAPVLAVQGNNDDAILMENLPEAVEFTVGPHRFGMIHGHGGASARSEAKRQFAGRVECAVYGHSHIPLIERDSGTILFNPGSATDRRWGPHFGIGLIHVTEDEIDPDLVLFSDPRHLTSIKPD